MSKPSVTPQVRMFHATNSSIGTNDSTGKKYLYVVKKKYNDTVQKGL